MDQNSPTPADEMSSEHGQTRLDPGMVADFQARLLRQQNLPLAAGAGLAAAVLGAVLWAGVTVATKYQIGWMAVGIGFLVGFAVRIFGKGVSSTFGVLGAGLALLGCVLGNLFSACGFVSIEQSAPLLDVAFTVLSRPALAVELLGIGFSPMDLLFYGIAGYEGYRFSFRQLTQADLSSLQTA